MGFISYHGEKSDNYNEVLEYSKAQQKEDLKAKQDDFNASWIQDMGFDRNLAFNNTQEQLKDVFLSCKKMNAFYDSIFDKESNKCSNIDTDLLWKDFLIDIANRHISAFHVDETTHIKHLDVFITRIFKIDYCLTAQKYFEEAHKNSTFRRYVSESFDVTWTGCYFYFFIKSISSNSIIGDFFECYKRLCMSIALYLFQVFRPIDKGWQKYIIEEKNGINRINKQIKANKHVVVNLALLKNPLFTDISADFDTIKGDAIDNLENDVDEIAFNKELFNTLIYSSNLKSFIQACKMVTDIGLEESIREKFLSLSERIPVLDEAIKKYDDIYHLDMDQFNEYYFPETMKVTFVLIEYEIANLSEEIVEITRDNVLQAVTKLIQVVNEKIDEIYKFVSIETNAEARALEAMMSQDGYVSDSLKIK